MKKHVILFAGIVCATALSLAVCAVGAPRQSVGRPVDAEPMSGGCLSGPRRCLGQQVQCLGADGAWHTLTTCVLPQHCVSGACQ
jgi:hypothetical protein